MRHVSKIGIMAFAVAVVVTAISAGCANAPLRTEASTSGIRAAEEVGAAKVPQASLHLQLAKEELELAKGLAAEGEKEKAASMVLRAEAEADADFQQKQSEMVTQGKQDLSDSEKQTADAMAELAKLAAVKEEERGLIVTLSGSVLFRSAESTLLPSAQVKLDQVANALLAVRERNLIVRGHTDSQGSDSYNQSLSQRRAEAVRDYLVQRGYPGDRIQARGMGESSPIAENASPEGRANNRRVEIIIERELKASSR